MYLPHPIIYYHKWKYKNTAFLLVGIALFFFVAETEFVKGIISHIGTFGYSGMFLTGIFYVSIFTVAPALAVLYEFTSLYSPLVISLVAGLGSVLGDFLIFRFVHDRVADELKPIFEKLEGSTAYNLFHTPYFFWLTPLLGAFIIASPFPDEIGIGILGISHIKHWQFIALSFALNTVGIFFVLHVVQLF